MNLRSGEPVRILARAGWMFVVRMPNNSLRTVSYAEFDAKPHEVDAEAARTAAAVRARAEPAEDAEL